MNKRMNNLIKFMLIKFMFPALIHKKTWEKQNLGKTDVILFH